MGRKTELPAAVDMRIVSNPAKLPVVRSAVRELAAAVGFSEETTEQIALATDEALANVIKHGYGGATDRPIDVRIEPVAQAAGTGLRLCIRDFGMGVDPTMIRGRDLDDVRPGGLGVHFIRTIMDEVRYEPAEGGGTRLSMVKLNRHE